MSFAIWWDFQEEFKNNPERYTNEGERVLREILENKNNENFKKVAEELDVLDESGNRVPETRGKLVLPPGANINITSPFGPVALGHGVPVNYDFRADGVSYLIEREWGFKNDNKTADYTYTASA